MNNTQYNDATAIKVLMREIDGTEATLVLDSFTDQTLRDAYRELGNEDEFYEYVGKLYHTAPAVTITGDGADAEAEAVITDGIVTAVNVTVPGHDYTEAEIVFSGGGGAGASAHALIGGSADSITSVVVDHVSLLARLYQKTVDLLADFAAL